MAVVDIGEYLTIDPEIMHGALTFKGTRVPVSMVLEYIEDGLSVDDVEEHWPQVSREAAREAVRLACESLHLRYRAELDAAEAEMLRIWAAIDAAKAREEAAASADAQADSRIAGGVARLQRRGHSVAVDDLRRAAARRRPPRRGWSCRFWRRCD